MSKKITLFTLMALSILGPYSVSIAQTTDLIISEYAEGSGNNKYIEIYNGTGSTVNLSNYQMWRISNGGLWPEYTVSLSGTLANGDVLVIANSSADVSITNLPNATTAFNSATYFNGDDAVGLAKDDGTGNFYLIDAVGTWGPDPGSGWDVSGTTNGTKDYTLVRHDTVCSPDTNWTTVVNSQWTVYPQNTWTYAGSHSSNCSSTTSSDTTKPAVINGNFLSQTMVEVVFSEPVTSATAQDLANYSFTPSITITNAVLSASMDTVTLTLASPGFLNGILYTANIQNIVDTSANANMMDPFTTDFFFNSYSGSDILITEIYYSQPSNGISSIDYFELYNAGSSQLSLAGMEFDDGIFGQIDTNIVIPAGEYFVFTQDIDSFNLAFPTVTNVAQWEGGSLSGGGSTITLKNTLGSIVATVSYSTSSPWPSFSNTMAIELCDVNTDYTVGSNWYEAGNISSTVAETLYGSPGSTNSCATPPAINTYDISVLRTVDADGIPDSLGVYCAIEGVVYGVDLDGNTGLSFTVIDQTGGINVWNFADVDNYVVNQGDMIRVVGTIEFFNGLTEIKPDSISVLSTGHCIPFPRVEILLDETTESDYIQFTNVELVDPSQWPSPGSNGNVDFITEFGDTLTMRLDKDSHIQDTITSPPSGLFNITGIGGQYDNSIPHTSGYQIFPMFISDIDTNDYSGPYDIQLNEIAVTNNSTFADEYGNYYQWVEVFNTSSNLVDITGYFVSTDSLYEYMERIDRCHNDTAVSVSIDPGEYAVGFFGAYNNEGPGYFSIEMVTYDPYIALYTPNGKRVDSYVFPASLSTEGYTYGAKNDDHTQGDVVFEKGTPEATNANGVILSIISLGRINNFNIYPNPVKNGLVNFSKQVSITVYNITGQIVMTRKNVNRLDVSTLDKGVYLIKTSEGAIVRMIVK